MSKKDGNYYVANTQNQSFIDLANQMNESGVRKWNQILKVYDYDLVDFNIFDPFVGCKTKAEETKMMRKIIKEAKDNIWFFFRELLLVDKQHFQLNIETLHMLYLYDKGISSVVVETPEEYEKNIYLNAGLTVYQILHEIDANEFYQAADKSILSINRDNTLRENSDAYNYLHENNNLSISPLHKSLVDVVHGFMVSPLKYIYNSKVMPFSFSDENIQREVALVMHAYFWFFIDSNYKHFALNLNDIRQYRISQISSLHTYICKYLKDGTKVGIIQGYSSTEKIHTDFLKNVPIISLKGFGIFKCDIDTIRGMTAACRIFSSDIEVTTYPTLDFTNLKNDMKPESMGCRKNEQAYTEDGGVTDLGDLVLEPGLTITEPDGSPIINIPLSEEKFVDISGEDDICMIPPEEPKEDRVSVGLEEKYEDPNTPERNENVAILEECKKKISSFCSNQIYLFENGIGDHQTLTAVLQDVDPVVFQQFMDLVEEKSNKKKADGMKMIEKSKVMDFVSRLNYVLDQQNKIIRDFINELNK